MEGDSRESFKPAEILAVPERRTMRDYDAWIPVEDGEGVDLKQVQIKGCFHSRKDNPERPSNLVVPYDTHNGNGDDYIYHLNTYTLEDEVEQLLPVNEAVLTYPEMDAFLNYVKWADPEGVSVHHSRGRRRAQIKPDLLMQYASTVHEQRPGPEKLLEQDLDKTRLYHAAEHAALDYTGQEDPFEIEYEDLEPELEEGQETLDGW